MGPAVWPDCGAGSATLPEAAGGHLAAVARNGLLAWFAARACPVARGLSTFTGTPAVAFGVVGAAVGAPAPARTAGEAAPSEAITITAAVAATPALRRTPAFHPNLDTIHPPEPPRPECGQPAIAQQEKVRNCPENDTVGYAAQ